MKRLLKAIALLAIVPVLLAIVAGCETDKKTEEKKSADLIKQVTKDNPIVVDKQGKKVMIYTEVQGKAFTEPSIHWGIVFKDGKVADKALFKSYASHEKFHAALVEIGAMPGDNLQIDKTDGKFVDGEALKVTASWGDKQNIPLSKVIKDPNGKDFDVRFGGNLKAAKDNNTGCITCLESCPIAITSNAVYPQGGYKEGKLKWTANSENLPKDGEAVIFTYSLKFGEGRTPALEMKSSNEMPTATRPLLVSKKDKEIRIYTEVNGIHLFEPTVHWGIVFKDGKYGDRAILKAYSNQNDFYEALVQIGAKPGNNLKLGETVGQVVKGDVLDVTAIIPGKSDKLSLGDIISDSSGNGFEIHFGGNQKAARTKNTGCITCLESCPIAVTSNGMYPMTDTVKRFLSPNSRFTGIQGVLPEDGKPVIVIYKLK